MVFLLLQDLFFKYTWNNFLHFQVELSIAAILSHSVQEGKPTTTDPESKDEVLNGNVATDNSQPPENSAENVMVTHVSLVVSPENFRPMGSAWMCINKKMVKRTVGGLGVCCEVSPCNLELSVLGGSVFAFIHLFLASNYKINLPPILFNGLVNLFLFNFLVKMYMNFGQKIQ